MDNWSELHPKRCNFLQNSHFSSTFSDFQKAYEGEIWCLSTACDFIVCIRSHQLWIVNVILNLWLQKVFILKIVTKRSLSCHKSPIFCPCTIVYLMQKKKITNYLHQIIALSSTTSSWRSTYSMHLVSMSQKHKTGERVFTEK